MKTTLTLASSLFALLALAILPACSDHHEAHESHGHAHTAPHGGTLIEIGEHQYNLELVRDAAAGTLTAYVLDAHAEHVVRLALPQLVLIATINRAPSPITLVAVPNSATGETIGDTAQFTAQTDWLKSTSSFDGVIPSLEIRGTVFTNIKLHFPSAH